MDTQRHPLLKKCYDTCIAIDAIAPSEQQTQASKTANELLCSINEMLRNMPPETGQPWPEQGGIYIGTLRNPDTGETHHHIMHPDALKAAAWGTEGEEIEGANSYWDGTANTAAMRASGHCSEIIAALDALHPVEGHSDYCIAAQAQLNLITCSLRDKVEPVAHWSSTQCSADTAWNQNCENGYQYLYLKVYRLAARAVRSILVIE